MNSNNQDAAGAGGIERLSQRVARRLRMRMAELQLKGTDVAAAIGMTQGSFSRRYTGNAAWELDELEQLEVQVGISVAYLFGWDQQAEAPATAPVPIVPVPPQAATGALPHAPAPRQVGGPPAPPAPPEPPTPPRLHFVDRAPIRFDSVAWPGPGPLVDGSASA